MRRRRQRREEWRLAGSRPHSPHDTCHIERAIGPCSSVDDAQRAKPFEGSECLSPSCGLSTHSCRQPPQDPLARCCPTQAWLRHCRQLTGSGFAVRAFSRRFEKLEPNSTVHVEGGLHAGIYAGEGGFSGAPLISETGRRGVSPSTFLGKMRVLLSVTSWPGAVVINWVGEAWDKRKDWNPSAASTTLIFPESRHVHWSSAPFIIVLIVNHCATEHGRSTC